MFNCRKKRLTIKNIINICLFLIFSLKLAGNNNITFLPNYKIQKPILRSSTNFNGDNQYQLVNKKCKYPLRVLVTDSIGNPLNSRRVYFKFISTPVNSKYYKLEKSKTYTDSLGIASTYIYIGSEPGVYEVAAYIHTITSENFVIFKIHAKKSNWLIILLIGLFGGLGLFLYGMRIMSEGLQKSAGNKMRAILSRLTYNRFIALIVGAFVTTIIQSSSATTVMLVSFVNSRLMRFKQTIGVFMGAAIGTTITAQIIAFKLTDYSLLFVGIGFFMMVLIKNQNYKNIGESILGFGVLFFGMYVMSKAMNPLKTYEPFMEIICKLENPILGILIGAIFTALIQSSSAFIGIMIILASQGFLNLQSSIPLLIGSNLGTVITALIASIEGTSESKQVAIGYTIFKAIGALIIIWWIKDFTILVGKITFLSFDKNVDLAQMSNNIPRQIANAHTIYNVIIALLFIPFINTYAKFINFILPVKSYQLKVLKIKYLDEKMISTPALAINLARQEVLRMIIIIRRMVILSIKPFLNKDVKALNDIDELEDQVNFLRDKINSYLLAITREKVKSEIIEEAFQLLFGVKEYEEIGDIISTNLKNKALSWCNSEYTFSEKGLKDLIDYHQITLKHIERSYKLYQKFSKKRAQKISRKYEIIKDIGFELDKQHFKRLKKAVEESLQSSNTHLELLSIYKQINNHATNVARILLD